MPPTESSIFELERQPVRYAHSVSEAGRLLPSESRWNSNLVITAYDSIPSQYPKSVDYNLVITDRDHFRRFVLVSVVIVFAIIAVVLVLHFLPHKHKHQGTSVNLKLAINQALTFYDAQKSGHYPRNSPVKFRGDSGLKDGNSANADLVGGFYDSGNNIKFTFTTAYAMTLLSWTVMEYQSKYADIGELDHVRDIIRWGSDYLLKVVIISPSTSESNLTLYSQVGSTISDEKGDQNNDISCWQRPEDMDYARPVSTCDSSASDLGGEVVAALSAASMVFKEDKDYSVKLVKAAESLYKVVTREDPKKQGTYTKVDACGKQARNFYESSGYKDELAWGATWLFLATENVTYLEYATETFKSAKSDRNFFDRGVFDWDNKLNAIAVLLTGIRYFRDPGLYEDVLRLSSNSTDSLMCSFLFNDFKRTPGGLVILKPDNGPLLQNAAAASFLSKLYSDYLDHLKISRAKCETNVFSVAMLRGFASSQVNYILGQNPKKMSYLVGFGDKFPVNVHHRSASIPWDNQRKHYSCDDGKKWLNSKEPNPQVLLGAMVGGPDTHDGFTDQRNNSRFTEPNIASNAGLIAALIALQDNSRDIKDSLSEWI